MLRKVLVLSCTAAALIASPCFAQKLPLSAGGEGHKCRTAPPGSGEQLCIRETGSDVNGIHHESSSDFSATRLKRGEQPGSQTNTTGSAQTASPGDASATSANNSAPAPDTAVNPKP